MARAGEEGYERPVICPYDRSHEVRKGRMQFHLEKCRRNNPLSPLVECKLISTHRVPEVELQYHMEEECEGRRSWDAFTHENQNVVCSVKDLVPVTAGELPPSEENWENEEVQGSVLSTIKEEAEKKNILRLKQCVPKSERKLFRQEERRKHAQMEDSVKNTPSSTLPSSCANIPTARPTTSGLGRNPPDQLSGQFSSIIINESTASSDFPSLPSPPRRINNVTNQFPPLSTYTKQRNIPSLPSDEFQPPTWGNNASSSYAGSSSVSSRPASTLSFVSSHSNANANRHQADEGFCSIQVPGSGRGRGRKLKSQN